MVTTSMSEIFGSLFTFIKIDVIFTQIRGEQTKGVAALIEVDKYAETPIFDNSAPTGLIFIIYPSI